MNPLLSVILPAHNPHPGRLQRTLDGLRRQTLPAENWETIVVDNASAEPLGSERLSAQGPANLRIVRENTLGLTAARRCGFGAARAAAAVLVDDDNVLDPEYLARALALLAAHPAVGALGGRVLPEFEEEPPAWCAEFYGLLALRDLGDQPQISQGLRPPGETRNLYPAFAPVGAGMVLRRAVWIQWFESLQEPGTVPTDRKGDDLTSGGDNDIILSLLRGGWQTAYFPELSLRHLIPPGRVQPKYLARLNRSIQRSWVVVLNRYGACPWRAIPRWSLRLRVARAWWRSRAWRGPAECVRWHGLAGRLTGQADLCPR